MSKERTNPAFYGHRKVDRDPFIDAIYASMPPIDQATHDRVLANARKVAELLSGAHVYAHAKEIP